MYLEDRIFQHGICDGYLKSHRFQIEKTAKQKWADGLIDGASYTLILEAVKYRRVSWRRAVTSAINFLADLTRKWRLGFRDQRASTAG